MKTETKNLISKKDFFAELFNKCADLSDIKIFCDYVECNYKDYPIYKLPKGDCTIYASGLTNKTYTSLLSIKRAITKCLEGDHE